MKVAIALVMLAFAAYMSPGIASAQDVQVAACDGCSIQEMKGRAIASGRGLHHFYDTTGRTLVGIETFAADEAHPDRLRAVVREPEQWMLDQFAALLVFHDANGHSWNGTRRISLAISGSSAPSSLRATHASGEYVNAYDVVGSATHRNRLSAALTDNPAMIFISVMSSFGRAIRLGGIATPDVDLTVYVELEDDSRVIYRFNWNTKRWDYVPGTAVDASNNNVPESAEQVASGGGRYTFDTHDDMLDWFRLVDQYGVEIGTGGMGSPMVCAGTQSTGITCRLDHN